MFWVLSYWFVNTLIGGIILGERSLNMGQTKVSSSTQFYLEHQIIYILKVKQHQMIKFTRVQSAKKLKDRICLETFLNNQSNV